MFTNYSIFYSDIKNHGIEYAVEHTVKLGFDAVEFLGYPKCFSAPSALSSTAKLLAENGLKVSCYSEGINLLDTSRATRSELETHLFKCADAAAELGSPYFHHTLVLPLALPSNAPAYCDILPTILNSAEKVARYCERLGLTCLYEPQGMYFNGEGLKIFFDEMKKRCQNIGICGDVGNSLFVDYSPNLIFDNFAKEIKHVHLKDYFISDAPFEGAKCYKTRGGRWLSDAPLGKGAVDIPYCLARLREQNYCGDYSFEVEGSDEVMKNATEYVKNLF